MRNVRGDDKKSEDESEFSGSRTQPQQVFGQEKIQNHLLPLTAVSIQHQGKITVEDCRQVGNTSSQEFFDYLTNPEADMMRIELDILGDPTLHLSGCAQPTEMSESERRPKRELKTTYIR